MSNTTQRYAVTIVAHYIVETDNPDGLADYYLPDLEDTGATVVEYDGGGVTFEPVAVTA